MNLKGREQEMVNGQEAIHEIVKKV